MSDLVEEFRLYKHYFEAGIFYLYAIKERNFDVDFMINEIQNKYTERRNRIRIKYTKKLERKK
jgi:hypothetical protein